ncbi:MAG: YaeQ family protein [Gammaproteobacteria bacterium]|mgnify:CR=1 FL=1|nr:YaeQ family protein [Gammaproteobacteria bacterium]
MALKATIFKAELQVSDMERHYYREHSLIIARHPSESAQRMMVRILAFALNANDRLAFTRGLSSENEPDLWQHSLSNEIELWIELGQPDVKRIGKACGRAKKVIVYSYANLSNLVWWEQNREKLKKFDNLCVVDLSAESTRELALLTDRSMQLQCTIQDGEVWLGNGIDSVHLSPKVRMRSD